MNVAHAIKPSGLSAEGPDPWDGEKEAVGSTARPPGSSRPGGFSSAPAQGAGEVQTPPPIPPRREARSEDPLLVSKGPSRNDAAGGSRSREPAAQDPLPDAKTLKERGVDQYKKRQFDDAILTFRRYLGAYPDDSQEVRWRLAQALFETNRWGEATQEFNELRGSPQADYRADAILKLGMIDQKKGDMVSARQQWKRVVETYPNTEAAKKASKFLAESP
jgi:TolA-binding protein